MRYLLPFLALLIALPAVAQQATVVRDTELKSEPYADAQTVQTLKSKQKVEIGERRGGWYQAQSSSGKSGWVRLTSVLFSSTQGKGSSGLSSATQFLTTGRSGSSGVTAATGVRGLDSADVVNATPNPQAVSDLDKVSVSANDSRKYAAAEKLKAHQIGYVDEK